MNHKPLLLPLACALLPTALAWGQSLGGTVRDRQHAAIPVATVSLLARDGSARLSATAGSEGAYRFERVAPGAYVLEAHASGFADSAAQPIQIGKGDRSDVDIELQVAGIATQIAVTATGTPQSSDEMSKALSTIDTQEIDARDAYSITDALSSVPGLLVRQLGGPGAFTSVKTRGLPVEDTAVLIDGYRLRDAAAAQGDASGLLEDLLVANVDRIEVLRGAGSSLYGSNAIGGVINIITNQGVNRTHGSLLVEGGSLGTFRGRAQVAGALKPDNWQYSLGLAHLNVTNGVNGDSPARTTALQGRVDYAFSPQVRLSGRVFATDSFAKVLDSPQSVSGVASSGSIDAVALSSSALRAYESGTPLSQLNIGGATFIPAVDNPDYTRAARIFSGALRVSVRPSESISITADYQGLKTRRRYGDGPAGVGYQPDGAILSFYDGEINTASTRVDWRLGRYQSIDAGYEFENESFGDSSLDPNPAANSAVSVTQRSNALFAQDQFHLLDGRLQLAASYRAQFFSLDRPAFTPPASAPYANTNFSAPPAAQTGDGSAAYFFRRSGTKLRAHTGKGYRAPSLYERFGSYYDSTYGYTTYGDPSLRPARSLTVDGGVDQALWNNRVRLSATYFYTALQEVILFDASGDINPAADPFGRYAGYRNTNGGLARGVESSATFAPTQALTLRAAYTFTNARERTPLVMGVYQTYDSPDHAFSLLATQQLSARWTLVCGLAMTSGYLAAIYDPVTYASAAYRFSGLTRLQAGANYRVPLGGTRALRLFAQTDNILNRTRYEDGFQMPGVTVRGGVQFEF